MGSTPTPSASKTYLATLPCHHDMTIRIKFRKFFHLIPCFMMALLSATTIAADSVIGIGVMLKTTEDEKTPVVIQVLPNSPAEIAGLPLGAAIEKVNGVKTAGRTLEECIALIRGPEGIPVLLEFIDPTTGKSKKLMIVRRKLEMGN